jgi:oligosaccharide repeat unit polymerase
VKFERALVGLYFLRQFSAIGITLAIFTLYYFLYLQRVRGIDLPRWQVLAAAACIGVNAFGIYAWGQRYGVAMAFVGLVVGYHYFVARLSLLRLAVLGGLFLALFLGLRVIRDTLVFPEGVISPLEGANIWRQTAIAMHGSQFDAFLLVLRDFDLEAGLRWGEDFWAGLAALAPRALWPDRPPFNPGAWFRQLYEPETQNGWPVTPIGEWLINFGWIGVAVGGAISGYLTRAAQQVYDDLWKNPWSMMMSFVVALFVIPGGVNSGTPQSFMLMILPLGVVALTLKLLTPARMRWNEAVHGY